MIKLACVTPGDPEIFLSLHGEGLSSGRPSVFVRLSQCNLHCVWCDTPYTWNFEGTDFAHRDGVSKFVRSDEVVSLERENLVGRIRSFQCERVIFTGGEPLLQQRELGELCGALKRADGAYFIEVETNGTIVPQGLVLECVDQFNVSPKLAHSKNELQLRRRDEALTAFAKDARASFKFVVTAVDDLEEVEDLIDAFSIERTRVYIMPEGVDTTTLVERARWISEECIKRGVNYSDRLQIHLYGNTRGT